MKSGLGRYVFDSFEETHNMSKLELRFLFKKLNIISDVIDKYYELKRFHESKTKGK